MSSTVEQWIEKAKADGEVWLDEVSRACAASGDCSPVIIEITLYNGKKRAFTRFFPHCNGEEQRRFVLEYLCASVFNVLSALGGSTLALYYESNDENLSSLIDALESVFCFAAAHRAGYGKPLNVADRVCAFLNKPQFSFVRRGIEEYIPAPEEPAATAPDLVASLRTSAERAAKGVHCGVDVGGTDIKLAVSVDGKLLCTREYDWNPAEFTRAEELIDPVLRLTRLMRACAADYIDCGAISRELQAALNKDTALSVLKSALEAAEKRLGDKLNVLDSVGLSFPDVVLRDAIVGGETPKTQGMRKNAALDYEREFGKITRLNLALEALCRAPGHVRVTNDGNIAAYTAAMELAHSEQAALVKKGVLAHSLGTDLGTGWLNARGEIPELTLELYDSIIDLGSWPSRDMSETDLRCVRNENSGLAGMRRYLGQAAVFRMAWAREKTLLDGFAEQNGDVISIKAKPHDMRKPCLEHIMAEAERGNTAAEEIFRQVGRNLAHVTREAASLLQPETELRFLFGRFVKRQRCFELICEGYAELDKSVTLVAADSGLACTPLMRQLDADSSVTVAQFGQAVGAIYFGLS